MRVGEGERKRGSEGRGDPGGGLSSEGRQKEVASNYSNLINPINILFPILFLSSRLSIHPCSTPQFSYHLQNISAGELDITNSRFPKFTFGIIPYSRPSLLRPRARNNISEIAEECITDCKSQNGILEIL